MDKAEGSTGTPATADSLGPTTAHPPTAALLDTPARRPGVLGAYVGLGVSLVVWGTLQPMAKVALGGLEPTQFTFLRAFMAGVALLLVCMATGRLRRLRAELTPLWMPVLLGVLAFTLSNHFSMAALVYLSAGTNTVLASTTPLFVAVGAPLLGEHAGMAGTLGAVLGFAGILVLSLGSDVGVAALPGVAMAMFAALAWGAHTVLARHLAQGRDAITLSGFGALVGCLPLGIVAGPAASASALLAAPLDVWLAMLWCGVIGTGLTFTLWASALRTLPASRVAPTQYLMPPLGLLFSWLILGEVPAPTLLVGAALILGGVAVAQRARL